MHRRRLLAAPFLVAPLAAPFAARGQSLFGDRPIRMIVPVAAAGASDIVARIVADAMTPLLGRQIVAENIAGAGSTLGANTFQQAPADGQTIYVNPDAIISIREPREENAEHYAPGTHCLLQTADGKSIIISDTCDTARVKLGRDMEPAK